MTSRALQAEKSKNRRRTFYSNTWHEKQLRWGGGEAKKKKKSREKGRDVNQNQKSLKTRKELQVRTKAGVVGVGLWGGGFCGVFFFFFLFFVG